MSEDGSGVGGCVVAVKSERGKKRVANRQS